MLHTLDHLPNTQNLRCGAVDLNGQARGKRIPLKKAAALAKDGVRFPLSALNLDMWGEDIEDSPLVFASGDADGRFLPTERGFVPMPWLAKPTALLPLWAYHDDGRPFAGDPRQALAAVLDRYAARGLTPVVATEMEFYLINDEGGTPTPPNSPRSGRARGGSDILSLREMDAFEEFFNDLYAGCAAMGIPADAATSEAGPGQFEINLEHQADALTAADDAWLFKVLVRGLARKHGLAGSFLAKPYAEDSGSGLHVHFSVLDRDGRNIFDDGGLGGTAALRHAIAGCLHASNDLALIFAPHSNSYARLVPGAHAPTGLCWAYENRTATVRVPGGPPAARRIEHRLAGADVNPYLLLAAILGAALTGMEDQHAPPEPITGNAYALDIPQVPSTWQSALSGFEQSALAPRIFAPELIDNMLRTKRQEMARCADLPPEQQIAHYLDLV